MSGTSQSSSKVAIDRSCMASPAIANNADIETGFGHLDSCRLFRLLSDAGNVVGCRLSAFGKKSVKAELPDAPQV